MRKSINQAGFDNTDILKLDHDLKMELLQEDNIGELSQKVAILENSLSLENISEQTRENIKENIKNLKEQINDLTTKKTYNYYIMDNSCYICLIQYIPVEQKCITNCNHSFCKSCLDTWFDEGKNSCPICRQIIQYFNYIYFSNVLHII